MAILLSTFSPELLSPFLPELSYLLLPHLLLSPSRRSRLIVAEKAMARRERRGATRAATGRGGGGRASPKLRVRCGGDAGAGEKRLPWGCRGEVGEAKDRRRWLGAPTMAAVAGFSSSSLSPPAMFFPSGVMLRWQNGTRGLLENRPCPRVPVS
jgi:hypothetical protein